LHLMSEEFFMTSYMVHVKFSKLQHKIPQNVVNGTFGNTKTIQAV